MDEEELFESFGLERPEEQPGEDPGQGTEGVETPPAEEGAEVVEAPGAEAEPPAQEGTPPIQAEEHRQESERLEAERVRQAGVDEAYAAAFAGRLNPYTQKPILSERDYRDYQDALKADQRRQQMEKLKAAGIDPEVIRGMVDEHPAVRQAQEAVRAAQAEQQRAQAAQAKAWFGEQVAAISALDPEVKSLDDLAAHYPEQYPKMLDMVGRGVALSDAYKALNFEALSAKRAAAVRQSTLNQSAGKAHLGPVGGQKKAPVEVPADIRAQFRDLYPDISDEEITRQYADYLRLSQ